MSAPDLPLDALDRLAAEMRGLADQLAAVSAARTAPRLRPEALARAAIDSRRRITAFFPEELFADPARDLLLELFIAAEQGKEVPVSSACIAAAVPTTTAMRWIAALRKGGLVSAVPDPQDGRRTHLTLTPDARGRMRSYLTAMSERLLKALGETDPPP